MKALHFKKGTVYIIVPHNRYIYVRCDTDLNMYIENWYEFVDIAWLKEGILKKDLAHKL